MSSAPPARSNRAARFRPQEEQGQVLILALLLLPVLLGLAAVVIDLGNWFEHRRHLQTQVDAAVFAAGSQWSFPCDASDDTRIVAEARKYVGAHTTASGVLFTSGTENDQIGSVSPSDLHLVLNGPHWTDASSPADFSGDGARVPASPSATYPTLCDTKTLQAKITEDNTPFFFGLFSPDLGAKARVEIREVEGLSGILPIAVRVPKPISAAAVFYDEATGNILDAEYLVQTSSAGASGTTTWSNNSTNPTFPRAATVNLPAGRVGVVIATSFYPACDATANPPGSGAGVFPKCLDVNVNVSPLVGTSVTTFCQRNDGAATNPTLIAQCFNATIDDGVTPPTQLVSSGLVPIRGYNPGAPSNTQAPVLESVWLSGGGASPECPGGYFNVLVNPCRVVVNAVVDAGGRNPADIDVRVSTNNCTFANCQLLNVGASGNDTTWQTPSNNNRPQVNPGSGATTFDIQVRLRNTTVGPTVCAPLVFTTPGCTFVFTDVQRTYVGSDATTGPLRTAAVVVSAGGDTDPGSDAAGMQSYYVTVGLKGGTATDVNEPAFSFNFKGSQSGRVDCDPNQANTVLEVENGCAPKYRVNDFSLNPPCPDINSINVFFNSPPAPWGTAGDPNAWPPYTCVITQTGNPQGPLTSGFSERIYDANNPPASCPPELGPGQFTKGRNYWSNANNTYDDFTWENTGGKFFPGGDPRLVTLFLTGYGTFNGSGNEVFPIVALGKFYITGWGRTSGGGGLTIEDPCPGNTAPPDLVLEPGGGYVWGHFVNYIEDQVNADPSIRLCRPGLSFNPCVPVLVE